VATNEATILLTVLYPSSPVDPVFLCNAVFSLLSVLAIQQVWAVPRPNEVLDEDMETRYLYTKKEVQSGLFTAAKDILAESEHYNDIIANARDKDRQLKTILRKHESSFRGNQYLSKPL
jgi:hypothetical protein